MNRIVPALVLVALAATLRPSDAEAARLVFEETIIEGELRKPEIQLYISRQNLNDRYQLELKESFLLKIVDSVESGPF